MAYTRNGCSGCGCSSCGRSNYRTSNRGCSSCGASNCGCNSSSGCGCNARVTVRRSNCGCSACGASTYGAPACGCGNARATARPNCGCKGDYGALNSVVGPMDRPDYEDFPFYTGPCGPCEPCRRCCCPDLPWPPPMPPMPEPIAPLCNASSPACGESAVPTLEEAGGSANFVAAAPLNVAAGARLNLAPTGSEGGNFIASQGGVLLHRAGTYLASYTVQVPEYQTMNSRLTLALNGSPLPAAALNAVKTGDGASASFTAQTTFEAPAGSLLTLESMDGVCIQSPAAFNVVALSVARLA